MADKTLFPPAEDDGCEPFRRIAAKVGCTEFQALDAFHGLAVPEWSTPEHQRAIKEETQNINTAVRHAKNLANSLRSLSQQQRADLIMSGMITHQQVEALKMCLQQDAASLTEYRSSLGGSTSRNPAAYVVAEGMRRLFRRLRKAITYGKSPDGGPTGEYCRAVEFAIGAFGIVASFDGPAKEANKKQRSIEARLSRMHLSRALKITKHHSEPDLKSAGVSVSVENRADGAKVVFKLENRKDVPPLELERDWFSSGAEIKRKAVNWAKSFSN